MQTFEQPKQTSTEALQNQLKIARNEINKLRQQVNTLQHLQRKGIEEAKRALNDFRCSSCRSAEKDEREETSKSPASDFQPIGIIRTSFPEKRAVPRQSSVAHRLRGLIEMNSNFFTNPEHSLEGLEEYSHMWIIYHFHRNLVGHTKAKVAPPRLGGQRVGVFGTRSPHRPCPIGLSLVEIDKIVGATVSFFGTDMVDGTPVLDIKPYIPFYDTPIDADRSGRLSVGPRETKDFYNLREEPDGEESEINLLGAASVVASLSTSNTYQNRSTSPQTSVKVPNWVAAGHRLVVHFNDHAESQISDLVMVDKQSIIDVLSTDPRSVFLRTKYGSQIFTFQLGEVTVTCKFDDAFGTVTVVQIRRTESV